MIANGVKLKEMLPESFVIEHSDEFGKEISIVTNVYGSLAGRTLIFDEDGDSKTWRINITYNDIFEDDLIYEINFPMYLHLMTETSDDLINFLKAVHIL